LSDEDAVEAVVRAFLDAAAQGIDVERFVTGPVRESLLRPAMFRASGWEYRRHNVKVRRLEVEDVNDGSALVALDAVCFAAVMHPVVGEQPVTMRIKGPARLVLEGSDWKIVTLKCDGIDWLSALYEPTPAILRLGPFQVSATAWHGPAWNGLLVVIENVSDRPGVVERVLTGGRVWWVFRDGFVLLGAARIEAGGELRRTLRLKGAALRHDIDVEVQTQDAKTTLSLAPPATFPLRRRLRHALHLDSMFQALLVVSAAYGVATGEWAGLAIAALIVGVMLFFGEIVSMFSGVRASAQLLYLTVGAAETVGGLLYLLSLRLDWSFLAFLLAPAFVYVGLRLRGQWHTARRMRER
jgi:hypothetical protein